MDYKSLLIGALGSALLFVSVGAGTAEQTTVNSTVPPSHVWEFHLSNPSNERSTQAFALNKETGEVRKYNAYTVEHLHQKYNNYSVCKEFER